MVRADAKGLADLGGAARAHAEPERGTESRRGGVLTFFGKTPLAKRCFGRKVGDIFGCSIASLSLSSQTMLLLPLPPPRTTRRRPRPRPPRAASRPPPPSSRPSSASAPTSPASPRASSRWAAAASAGDLSEFNQCAGQLALLHAGALAARAGREGQGGNGGGGGRGRQGGAGAEGGGGGFGGHEGGDGDDDDAKERGGAKTGARQREAGRDTYTGGRP